MFDEGFVSKKVQDLLLLAKNRGSFRLPVEPSEIANLCSVVSVEDRPMIPEGVLAPVPGGFKVFLQDNFASDPGSRIRRRFTFAHELVHTFFYSVEGNSPRAMKGAPRGPKLERLCQFGAGEILVPEFLLKQNLPSGKAASAEDLLQLAATFDVSLEVIFRRIQKLGLVAEDEFAAALVDRARRGLSEGWNLIRGWNRCGRSEGRTLDLELRSLPRQRRSGREKSTDQGGPTFSS